MIDQFIRNFCLKGCKNIKKYRIVLGFGCWALRLAQDKLLSWTVGIGRWETSSIFYLLHQSSISLRTLNCQSPLIINQ